ncbi:transcription elongation factor A protein 3 isoform X3 [Siniperca chuatsi]|uniref:transcription elongation factor A protein 3 isoform X3 n=1 Tax=Siniperca chuatsi TaxID=119488 RepID=UPI001CE084BD|nr:transcription elongation factor A protein 3 isoform X3 [Siniperca chuatsi]
MTREEDLIRIAKKLDKMVSRNNTEGAMDLLRELKGFNMTLRLLQETRIGMSVNGIRKHCTDEEVIALAKVLIKDWKRLLDSEKPSETKNGLDSSKTAASPNSSPSETKSSHRRLDVKPKHDSDPDKKHSNKYRKEKQNDEHKNKTERHADDLWDEKHLEEPQNEKHPQEIRKEKHLEELKKQKPAEDAQLELDNKKRKHVQDLQGEKHKPEPRKERLLEEPKKMRHVEEVKKEKHPEEPKKHSYTDDMKKDKHREESRHERPQRERPLNEKPADAQKPIFERRGVLDSTILYPTRFPSPPRPARPPPPIKRPSVDLKKDSFLTGSWPNRMPTVHDACCDGSVRKDGKDSSSRQPRPQAPRPASPPAKRPSLEVKKERKVPPDPNAPIAPLPFHLHPPPPRKVPPDPNAPIAPLPFHLHPPPPRKEPPDPNTPLPSLPLHPPPPPKRPSLDGKKDSRKESSDSKPPSQKKTSDHVKKDRKDSSDSKLYMNIQTEFQQPPKKPSVDVKKEKHRKDSCDSKPGQPVKRHSTDSKPDRRESTDSKKSSSPPAKKLTAERRESHSSKTAQPGPPQRKPSTDSIERKGKTDAPKTPTTPTSPMSPSFSSAGGPLPPHLATGDSVRDKCIEMLAAALRTDNDYKDFGTNCDSMAAEIEDHIYQDVKATDMKYKNRVRSRISNLKDPKNPGLRRNVLAGSIELSRIATMSAEEMASDELKQLRNVLTQEAIREHQMAKTGGTTTDLLQCGKCKKKNCTYNQVQTRSADEPMTTFVLCNECGNRWKFC